MSPESDASESVNGRNYGKTTKALSLLVDGVLDYNRIKAELAESQLLSSELLGRAEAAERAVAEQRRRADAAARRAGLNRERADASEALSDALLRGTYPDVFGSSPSPSPSETHGSPEDAMDLSCAEGLCDRAHARARARARAPAPAALHAALAESMQLRIVALEAEVESLTHDLQAARAAELASCERADLAQLIAGMYLEMHET